MITGVEFGAEDYLRKPVGIRERVARINRFIDGPKEMRIGKLTIVLAQGKAIWAGNVIHLASRELQILGQLSKIEGQMDLRETIQQLVDLNGDPSRAINIQVSRLRKKLKSASG